MGLINFRQKEFRGAKLSLKIRVIYSFTRQTLGKTLLKVKLLVGPTCKIPLNSKERLGNKANLRCAKIYSLEIMGGMEI